MPSPDNDGYVDEHIHSALHKMFGNEMNMYWSAWANATLTEDEVAALKRYDVTMQANTVGYES